VVVTQASNGAGARRLTLRPATEADQAAMAAVQLEAYWSNIDVFSPGAHAKAGYRERVLQAAASDALENWRNATVAVADNIIAAVCYIEPAPLLLEGLWVQPNWHGRGIGSALILDALGRFRELGAPHVMIEVHPQNPARRLYERHGFSVVEETERWSQGLQLILPLLVMKRSPA
jgi:[ribosomal protein S18]-alanine N-acetyltransferase